MPKQLLPQNNKQWESNQCIGYTGGSSSGGQNNATTAGASYNRGMATFTITKGGLMYKVSVGGQTFEFQRR